MPTISCSLLYVSYCSNNASKTQKAITCGITHMGMLQFQVFKCEIWLFTGYYCRWILFILNIWVNLIYFVHLVSTFIGLKMLYVVVSLHINRQNATNLFLCHVACVLNIVFFWYSKSLKGHGTRSSLVFRSWKTDKTCCAVWRRSEPLFPHLQPITFVHMDSPLDHKLHICIHSFIQQMLFSM